MSMYESIPAAPRGHESAVVMKCMQMPAADCSAGAMPMHQISRRVLRDKSLLFVSTNLLSVAYFSPQRDHRCRLFEGTEYAEKRNCCFTNAHENRRSCHSVSVVFATRRFPNTHSASVKQCLCVERVSQSSDNTRVWWV
jgi:hypothetical protein